MSHKSQTKMVPLPTDVIIPERDIGKQPVLDIRNLGIDFGGLTAVDSFTLAIGPTEIAGLIGPNGAGKTTIFNLLTNVYQPTRGSILLRGFDDYRMLIYAIVLILVMLLNANARVKQFKLTCTQKLRSLFSRKEASK